MRKLLSSDGARRPAPTVDAVAIWEPSYSGKFNMPESAPAKPNLSDLMVVVACLACCLPAYREIIPAFQAQLNAPVPLKFTLKYYYFAGIIMPALSAASLAISCLQIKRSGWSRLSRHPGVVACIAASVSLVPLVIWVALIRNSSQKPTFSSWPLLITLEVWQRVGYAVAGAWVALAITRGWRRPSTWIDVMGTSFGFVWILAPAWALLIQIT